MTETAVSGAPKDGHGDALPEGPSDADLIASVRGGDVEAYGVLFARHVDSARRLARSLTSDGEADDLVSEAFAKVLVVLQRGEGPDTALRPYLLTALRRLHVDRIRSVARTRPTEDMSAYDSGEAFQDTAVAGFENGAAKRAFESLPERWQLVLWHLEVEGQKPADIAPLLGISANSVSALAYRAREGLRQAFVSMHAQDADDEQCRTTRAHLGAFIRNDISKRDGAAVEAHLRDCRECSGIYLELVEVNSDLRALIAPLVLGGAATAFLSATSLSGTGAAAGGVAGLFGTITTFVADNAAKTIAGAAAASVAVAGVVVGVSASGLVGGGPEPRDTARESTVSQTTDPSDPTAQGDDDAPGGSDGKPGTSGEPGEPGDKPIKPGVSVPGVSPEDTPGDVPAADEDAETDGGGDPKPTQPAEPEPQPEPEPEPEPSEPPPTEPTIAAAATGTGGLAWVVRLTATEAGTLTVTLDRPAVGIHLDPRCDLISLGRLTCRLKGPGTIQLLVTPVPGATTTLTAVLQPSGDRSSVRLG